MNAHQHLIRLLPAAVCLCLVGSAQAGEIGRALEIRGFGTVGGAYSDTRGAEFIRDITQPRGATGGWDGKLDTRFGLQVNARMGADLEAVGQVVSAYNHSGNFSPDLEWAFLRYRIDPLLQLRAGRLGWDVYMLSDSRNIGYSYIWVRPPVEYFGPLQITHFDGGDALCSWPLANGIASLKLYAGRASQELPAPPAADYDLDGTIVAGANFDYRRGDWLFRVGYAAVNPNAEVANQQPLLAALNATALPDAHRLAEQLALAGKRIDILSAGTAFEHGPWQAQLLYQHLMSDSLIQPAKDAGYVLLAYRLGLWTPYLNVSGSIAHPDHHVLTGLPLPNVLDSAVSDMLPRAEATQRTLSLGVRYDIFKNVDLKAQIDEIETFDHATFLWRNTTRTWDGGGTVFTLTLDFIF